MSSDVVSPFSVRVFAALAFARIVLLTLGKLLSVLALRAVYDMFSVEALADLADSCSGFVFGAVSPALTLFTIQLHHALFTLTQTYTPTFLHVDVIYLASEVWTALKPCFPPPGILYCVFAQGLGCEALAARQPFIDAFSELGTRLACHLVDTASSLALAFSDSMLIMLSSRLLWTSLVFAFAFLTFSTIWLLPSFGWTLDDQELEPFDSINARLALVFTKIRRLLIRLKKHDIHAVCAALLTYIFWPTAFLRAYCLDSIYYDPASRDKFYCSRAPIAYIYKRLVRMALESRFVQVAPVALKVLGIVLVMLYCVMFDISVWRCYCKRKLRSFKNTLIVPTKDLEGLHALQCLPVVGIRVVPCPPSIMESRPPSVVLATDTSITTTGTNDALEDGSSLAPYPANAISPYFPDDYDINLDVAFKYGFYNDIDLGAGGNGFVLQGWRRDDGLQVAIKVIIRRRSSKYWPVHPKFGQVPFDVIVMEKLDHRSIIPMLDVFSDDRYVYVVQELAGTPWFPSDEAERAYYPDGDRSLHGYLRQHGFMSLEDAWFVFAQLIDAVGYLHSQGFAHCDIKPSNILIDDKLQVKLIDFGNVFELPEDWNLLDNLGFKCTGILGTRIYSPPELFWGDPFVPEKLDVWALGITLFEMLTGSRPYIDEDSIKDGKIYLELEEIVNLEALVAMWPILMTCLDDVPRSRGTLDDLSKPGKPFPFWDIMAWKIPRKYVACARAGPAISEID